MVRQRHGGRPQAYLTMDAFSQGRLRVSEREGGNKIKTAIKKKKKDAVQIIITVGVGGVFGSYHFDLETLNHPVKIHRDCFHSES